MHQKQVLNQQYQLNTSRVAWVCFGLAMASFFISIAQTNIGFTMNLIPALFPLYVFLFYRRMTTLRLKRLKCAVVYYAIITILFLAISAILTITTIALYFYLNYSEQCHQKGDHYRCQEEEGTYTYEIDQQDHQYLMIACVFNLLAYLIIVQIVVRLYNDLARFELHAKIYSTFERNPQWPLADGLIFRNEVRPQNIQQVHPIVQNQQLNIN